MVTIVNAEPHASVVKEIVCRQGCGRTLGYVPNDVVKREWHDYRDGASGKEYVNCPCGKEVVIRSW